MQGFASTRESRCKQEVNVVASDLNDELRALRAARLERKHPTHYFMRRMQIAVFNAGNKMAAIEQHWKV
jgi:hypothetical protein